jgi:hypothetical protein
MVFHDVLVEVCRSWEVLSIIESDMSLIGFLSETYSQTNGHEYLLRMGSQNRSGLKSLLRGSQNRVRMMLSPCSCSILSSCAAIENSSEAGVGLEPGKSTSVVDLPSREPQTLG